MIIDTSALMAIVIQESGYEDLLDQITEAEPAAGVPSTVLVELGMVLSARLHLDARPLVSGLITQLGLEVIPFTQHHWHSAVGAFTRFGRGRHTAGLNFGDCVSYATADLAGEPLLFVGEHFSHTDLRPA